MKSNYRYSVLFLFLIITHVGCSVTPKMKQPIWIDVRTEEEYVQGHLANAINIPYEEIGARVSQVTEDKSADIRVYCRTGRRSGIAKETLESLGYDHVTNEGGYQDLISR